MSAKVIAEKIHLQSFKILSAVLDCPFSFNPQNIERFETNTTFDLAFNFEDNMIKADLQVNVNTFSEADTNKEECEAKFSLVFLFFVENFKDLATILEDNTLDLKGGLANALASISYSTARGVLMTRFQGTSFSEFILPVIDPNKLIGNNK